MAKPKKYNITFRIWINSDGEKLLGIGRVELLQNIKNTGSITQAAKLMKMSYRQAWQMVTEMNERAKKPLVVKLLGGKSGGGAKLTYEGEKAIVEFYKLNDKVEALLKSESKTINL